MKNKIYHVDAKIKDIQNCWYKTESRKSRIISISNYISWKGFYFTNCLDVCNNPPYLETSLTEPVLTHALYGRLT